MTRKWRGRSQQTDNLNVSAWCWPDRLPKGRTLDRCLQLGSKSHSIGRFCLVFAALLLTGCGSIISCTVPDQAHGNQFYLGVQWDLRDTAWKYLTMIDLPLSMMVDTLLLPVDWRHGPYD